MQLKVNRNRLSKRKCCVLWLICNAVMLDQAMPTLAAPQNPFEAIGAGALSIANGAAEMMQNGAAVRKEHGFEMPFGAVHSRSEAGMGSAMRRHNDNDSEEDSDEKRRKRAAPVLRNFVADKRVKLRHLHRIKRAPCHNMQTTPSDDGVDGGDADVRRRRANQKKAAQRKRNTTSKTRAKSKTKKFATLERRRRQTELDDLERDFGSANSTLKDQAGHFANQMRDMWDSFMDSMNSIVQRVQQSFANDQFEQRT